MESPKRVWFQGREYIVSPLESPTHIAITHDGQLLGIGKWNGVQIEDCALADADLIEAIEDALRDPSARSSHPAADIEIRRQHKEGEHHQQIRRYLSTQLIRSTTTDKHETTKNFKLSIIFREQRSSHDDVPVDFTFIHGTRYHFCQMEFTPSPGVTITGQTTHSHPIARHGQSDPYVLSCTHDPKKSEPYRTTNLGLQLPTAHQHYITVRVFSHDSELAATRILITPDSQKPPQIEIIMAPIGQWLYWTIIVTPPEYLESCEGINFEAESRVSIRDAKKISQDFLRWLTSKQEPSPKKYNRIMLLGRRLYNIAPTQFKELYSQLKRQYGQLKIQFYCDGPFVPWEIMCTNEDTDLLMMRDMVARWPNRERLSRPYRKTISGTIHAIISQRTLDETTARNELILLHANLGAKHISASHEAVLRLLRGEAHESVALLYFAGHGKINKTAPDLSSIDLDDDQLQLHEIESANPTLGKLYGTFAFFNRCEIGQDATAQGSLSGWPGMLIKHGFGGFLGPVHPIRGDVAFLFGQEFLQRVIGESERVPISVALRDIRAKHAREHPQMISYIYYGGVDTRFT